MATSLYSQIQRFGRPREEILARDNWMCVICFSVEDLTIDHIDGNGRHSKFPNNELSNLRTLCRKCHGKIDGKRGGGSPTTKFKKGHIPFPFSYEELIERGRQLGISRKGIRFSKEHKRKISLAKIGKKRTPFTKEHKQKMHQARLAYWRQKKLYLD